MNRPSALFAQRRTGLFATGVVAIVLVTLIANGVPSQDGFLDGPMNVGLYGTVTSFAIVGGAAAFVGHLVGSSLSAGPQSATYPHPISSSLPARRLVYVAALEVTLLFAGAFVLGSAFAYTRAWLETGLPPSGFALLVIGIANIGLLSSWGILVGCVLSARIRLGAKLAAITAITPYAMLVIYGYGQQLSGWSLFGVLDFSWEPAYAPRTSKLLILAAFISLLALLLLEFSSRVIGSRLDLDVGGQWRTRGAAIAVLGFGALLYSPEGQQEYFTQRDARDYRCSAVGVSQICLWPRRENLLENYTEALSALTQAQGATHLFDGSYIDDGLESLESAHRLNTAQYPRSSRDAATLLISIQAAVATDAYLNAGCFTELAAARVEAVTELLGHRVDQAPVASSAELVATQYAYLSSLAPAEQDRVMTEWFTGRCP